MSLHILQGILQQQQQQQPPPYKRLRTDDINNNNTLPPLLVNLLNLWTFPFSTLYFSFMFFLFLSINASLRLWHTQNKCYPSTTHVTEQYILYDRRFKSIWPTFHCFILFIVPLLNIYYCVVAVLYLPLLFC